MRSREPVSTAFSNRGNKNIVRDLIELLREANQEIPAWFETIVHKNAFGNGSGGGSRGQGGCGQGRGSASRDYRSASHSGGGGYGGGGGDSGSGGGWW